MDNFRNQEPFAKQGLYDPRFEHDNCGIGSVVNINGIKSRQVVDNALSTEPVKMQKARLVTVLVFSCRFHTNSLRPKQLSLVLTLVKKEITVSECFSSHKIT